MSSTGMLLILLAIFIIFNTDKIAWIMTGHLKLNHAKPWSGISSSGTW